MLDENPSQTLDIYARIAESRKAQGLTLSKVSAALKIRSAYLKAIESGNLDAIPPGMYANAYIRSYAKFLGLEYEDPPQSDVSNLSNLKRSDNIMNATKPSTRIIYISLLLVILVNLIYYFFM
jgi:cytoskeletal protein RodZ